MITHEKLLPCPFCGGEAEIWRASADPKRPAWVGCMGRCAVLVSREYETTEEAIAAWNRRTPPAAGPEPWGWLCNGKGDGWEERDKVVRDPELIARYRERPDLWRIEPLHLGSPPAAVPDGWVMVPKEPTPEMCNAALKELSDITVRSKKAAAWDAVRAYRAMISASPTPPVEAEDAHA